MTVINRRSYLKAVGTVPVVGVVAGCLGSGDTGTLATQVTDQPGDIADFDSCVVTIVGMWLGPEDTDAGDEEDEAPAGREYHEYDEAQQADLVELQDGQTQLIDEQDLDTTTYEFLQLDVDEIDATLEDGSSTTVEVPGEAPLTFNEQFDIREDTRTVFTADFTPVKRGRTDTYVLQPVPDGINVDYEDE